MSEESACIDGYDNIGLEVPHGMLNKFPSAEDGNFKIVASYLRELAEQSAHILAERQSRE